MHVVLKMTTIMAVVPLVVEGADDRFREAHGEDTKLISSASDLG